MSQTAPEPPAEPPAGATDHERIGAIETEQRRQGGVLDRVVSLLEGKGDDATAGDGSVTRAGDPPEDMSALMEAAVRKVNAEQPPPAVAKPEPEKPPREPGRARERLQKAMFGSVKGEKR